MSSSGILANDLSRRIPALLTTMSIRPQSATARSTVALTAATSETSAPHAMAVPPAARISATTGSGSLTSLTTTLAPRAARTSA